MNDNIYYNDIDSDVDADTSLANLDISRLNNISSDVDTSKIKTSVGNELGMFAANNLYRKTADNLERAEAMVDDTPLRTEKTAELERIDDEENE